MRNLLRNLFLFSIFLSPSANADMFGISESQMFIQLLELVKTGKEQLETAKEVYDVSNEVYQLSRAENTSLDTVLNSDLVGLMRKEGWMVDGLDSMQSVADIDRQIYHMNRMMSEIEDPNVRERLQYSIDLLKQQRTIMELSQQTEKNLNKAVTDLDERDSSRITAENTSILARQAMAEQDRLNRKAALQKAAASDERQFTKDAAHLYRNIGKR